MYIRVFGRVDSFDDTSYDRPAKKEGEKPDHVDRFQLTLSLPGAQELMKFDLIPGTTEMPTTQQMEGWEEQGTWVVVESDSMRLAKGDTEGRAWALVSFTASSAAAMSATDTKELSAKRKAAKLKKKEAAAAKKAAKKASAANTKAA